MRRRFFNKIGGGGLPTDNFIVFDKSVSDPANITISEDSDFLNRLITSGFYRVLCKSAMGGGEVFVCRLDDNDSNLYFDGSQAVLTGVEQEVAQLQQREAATLPEVWILKTKVQSTFAA